MSFSRDDFVDLDIQPHRWSNYCLYCHTENFEPAALHGLRLWHYCVMCVLLCEKCNEEKPIYAFPYNRESPSFQAWKRTQDEGRRSNRTPEALSRADKTAHKPVCSHCEGRTLDLIEKKEREALQLKQLEDAKKQKAMLETPTAKAALDAMLKRSR